MPPIIYDAPYAAPFFPQQSIFQYLFPEAPGVSPLEAFDESLPAFIDGKTGRTLSRGELKDAALRLGAAMRGVELGGVGEGMGLKKGDVACIWGFNSLEWVVAAYGCLAGGVTLSPGNAG